jgi:GT2 family glycosyltransferase
MPKKPFIEIHIPFKKTEDFVLESVKNCLELDYPDFGILLLPDEETSFPIKDRKIRIIPTNGGNIPKKRNMGIRNCSKKAEMIAYVDSDAYPEKNWLKNSLNHFEDKDIFAVGGPNLTPLDEEFKRRIAGNVLAEKIAFGGGSIRHKIGKTRLIGELPTCNLIIRNSFLKENLFDENLATGEDAKMCSEIIKKGGKVLYASDVIVYHHRREIFSPMMKQLYYYGYYKFILFKDKSILSTYNLVPSLFLIYLIMGFSLSLLSNTIFLLYKLSLVVYFLVVFTNTLIVIRYSRDIIPTMMGVFLGHISYGYGFIASAIKNG